MISKCLGRSRIWLPCGWNSWKNVDLDEPTSFLVCSTWMQTEQNYQWPKQRMFESRISAGATEKLPRREKPHVKQPRGLTPWKDMLENALWETASWQKKTEQLYKVSSPCLDDHQFKKEELESVGESLKVCSQIVLKCLYLARMVDLIFLWSVNKLARAITKWTQACDRRWARLISYIHHTDDYRQHCHVGNTAQHRRPGVIPRLRHCWRLWRL